MLLGPALTLGLQRPRPRLFPGASFYADFLANEGFNGSFASAASLLSTTRASDAYSDNAAGVWSLFGSGVPRITDKGLLVEEARTNSIRNNSGQGAVAGTPGTDPTTWSLTTPLAGLAKTIVGTGTENGIDYIDVRYVGTTSATTGIILFESTATQIVAAQNQVWTDGAFLALTINSGATPTVTLRISERNGAGSQIDARDSSALAVTTTLTRFSFTTTLAQALTASIVPQILFGFANTTAYDFTLRIGWPQLELGSFATSPIRTTSAAATRAADVVSVTSPPALNVSAGALFAEAMLPNTPAASTFPTVVQVSDGSTNNFVRILSNSSLNHRIALSSGGVSQADFNAGGAFVVGTASKVAVAYALNDIASAYNGTVGATDTSATMPAALSAVNLGALAAGGNYLNGYIRRVAYFPTRLTNAQLQAITT